MPAGLFDKSVDLTQTEACAFSAAFVETDVGHLVEGISRRFDIGLRGLHIGHRNQIRNDRNGRPPRAPQDTRSMACRVHAEPRIVLPPSMMMV